MALALRVLGQHGAAGGAGARAQVHEREGVVRAKGQQAGDELELVAALLLALFRERREVAGDLFGLPDGRIGIGIGGIRLRVILSGLARSRVLLGKQLLGGARMDPGGESCPWQVARPPRLNWLTDRAVRPEEPLRQE